MVDMPGKGGTTLFELGDGHCTKVATFRERDFGSGATLEWFLAQIHARYPSDHLGVSILDHGYAWRGFSWDQTSAWDNITMPEMTRAVEGAGVPIDVLSFDACNMGDVEVAYQLAQMQAGSPAAPLVKYLVGSEEEIDQDGIPYDIAFAPLVADPSLVPADVARDLVTAYQRYYLPRRSFNWTSMSAIDVGAVGAATADLQAWVARMKLDLPTLKSRYDADLKTCIYAWESWHVDVAQLCDALAADPQIADTTLKTLSATVAKDCRGAVLGLWSGSYSAAYQGMTIWWGADQDWPYYRSDYLHQVAFGQPAPTGAGWYAFLKAYNAMAAAGSAAPAALPTAPAHHGAKAATARHSTKALGDRLGWPHTTTVRASYGLTGVDFIDQQNGWAVGYNNVSENAIILHTTDGGAHWRNRSPLAWYAYEFGGIDALDPAHIWTAGSESWVDSLITGSTDGSTWKTEPSHTYEYLMSVDFTDAQNGWVSGTNGALLHTTDGGAHWAKAPTWDGARGDDLWAVDFTDAQHGWIAGGNAATLTGFIYRTTDGGQTWTVQQVVPGAVLYGIEAPRCAVGGDPVTGAGVAYYSTDNGAIWAPSAGVPADTCLAKVTRAPGGTVDWAVGSGGTVLESTDGGATWTAPAGAVPATFDLAAASFISDTDGWIVGRRRADAAHHRRWRQLAVDRRRRGLAAGTRARGRYRVHRWHQESSVRL